MGGLKEVGRKKRRGMREGTLLMVDGNVYWRL